VLPLRDDERGLTVIGRPHEDGASRASVSAHNDHVARSVEGARDGKTYGPAAGGLVDARLVGGEGHRVAT